jgi:hypothetical protein
MSHLFFSRETQKDENQLARVLSLIVGLPRLNQLWWMPGSYILMENLRLKVNLATISNLSYFLLNPTQESLDHFISFVSLLPPRATAGALRLMSPYYNL